MTLAVKVVLNPNTTNLSSGKELILIEGQFRWLVQIESMYRQQNLTQKLKFASQMKENIGGKRKKYLLQAEITHYGTTSMLW